VSSLQLPSHHLHTHTRGFTYCLKHKLRDSLTV
jgi:hypothetical protein